MTTTGVNRYLCYCPLLCWQDHYIIWLGVWLYQCNQLLF